MIRHSTLFLLFSTLLCLIQVFSQVGGHKILPNPDKDKFINRVVAEGFQFPVNFEFVPDGRIFVAEKNGTLRIINDDGTLDPVPWIDLSDEITNNGDKGLLGIAVHPNFLQNKYVFLLYTQDPVFGPPDEPADSVTQSRLVRFTEGPDGRADLASKKIFIGEQWGKGFPMCDNSHSIGDVHFGNDGSLLLTAGDGAHWEIVDGGQNWNEFDHACEEYFGAEFDVGAWRSQMPNSLAGKLLRLDPDTGAGIGPNNNKGWKPNPYYDPANPNSVESMTWAKGLRNSFRFTVRPDTNIPGPGTVFSGEVGWADWEELNRVRNGGENLGWPCYQGPIADPLYNSIYEQKAIADNCAALIPNLGPEGKMPFLFWHHSMPSKDGFDVGFTGNAASGAAIYTGDKYPLQYRGDSNFRAMFFSDFGAQMIRVCWIDENDDLVEDYGIQDFFYGLGNVVSIKTDPVSGDLFYVSSTPGGLHRFEYAGGNDEAGTPPICTINADIVTGTVPLTVSFTSDDSYDLEGGPLRFMFEFGDNTAPSDLANVQHTYNKAGTYTAKLTVWDNTDLSSTSTITIIAMDDEAPTVKITSPESGYIFDDGESLTFTATVTDKESTNDELIYRWEVRLVHNNHKHENEFVSPDKTITIIPSNYVSKLERNMLEIYLTVTDPAGLSTTDMIRMMPKGMPNSPPKVSFDNNPAEGAAPLTVSFTSTSTDAEDDYLIYEWDFGDGFVTKGQPLSVKHTYDKPGVYTVKLTVYESLGTTGQATTDINVGPRTFVPTPLVYPEGGSYLTGESVPVRIILSDATVEIRYTVDGSNPTQASLRYTKPIILTTSTTLKVKAFVDGMTPSKTITYEYSFTSPDEGLLLHYNFEPIQNGQVLDVSGNKYNGIIHSNPLYKNDSGVLGYYLNFDQPATQDDVQYVDLGKNIPIDNGQLSFAAWVRIFDTDANIYMKLMSWKDEWNGPAGFEVEYNPALNAISFLATNDLVGKAEGVDLPSNEWHHIAISADGTKVTIYVDGKDVTTMNAITPVTPNNLRNLFIGTNIVTKPAAATFIGSIDELYLYNVPITARIIRYLMTANPNVTFTDFHPNPTSTNTNNDNNNNTNDNNNNDTNENNNSDSKNIEETLIDNNNSDPDPARVASGSGGMINYYFYSLCVAGVMATLLFTPRNNNNRR